MTLKLLHFGVMDEKMLLLKRNVLERRNARLAKPNLPAHVDIIIVDRVNHKSFSINLIDNGQEARKLALNKRKFEDQNEANQTQCARSISALVPHWPMNIKRNVY